MALEFPEFRISGKHTRNPYWAKIDMVLAATATAPDWSSPAALTRNPFTDIPGCSDTMAIEIGLMESSDASFVCRNIVVTGTTKMLTLLEAINPDTQQWHIRIHIKENGGSYSVFRWYVIAWESLQITKPTTDAATWTIKFDARNNLSILEDITIDATWFTNYLAHATYDYDPNNVYLSYHFGGSYYRQKLVTQYHHTGRTWNGFAEKMNFIHLPTIVQRLGASIGITEPLNNSAATAHTWAFKWYDGSNIQSATWDDLYVSSGMLYQHVAEGDTDTGAIWHQEYGYFDPADVGGCSFYNCGTAMEMLKAILVPFGLTCTARFDGDDRYLLVRELQDITAITPVNINTGMRQSFGERVAKGIRVTRPNWGEYNYGSTGDTAAAIECRFTLAQRCALWKTGYPVGTVDQPNILHTALYVKSGSDMYSVYSIEVQTDGTGSYEHEYNYDTGGLEVCDAAAHYYYAPNQTDTIGIYRPKSRTLEFEVAGLALAATTLAPIYDLVKYVDYNSEKYWVDEVEYDLRAGKTKIRCTSVD